MALTNFAALTDEQKTVWAKDVWMAARNQMFLNRFLGDGPDAMIQRITELKKTEKGARAVITLVADLEGDGVAGDRTLEGNEEALKSYDQVIQIDQLRHANRGEGRMADQKSVVNFRESSKNVLAYWLADRLDQMGFLTLSGVAYTKKNDDTNRTGSDLPYLEFAADVTTPSSNRYLVWDGGNKDFTTNSANSSLAAADTPTWEMLIELKAYAQDNYIKPIRGEMGMELYNLFMTPKGVAALKKDTNFINAWKDARERGPNNPLFKGADVIYVDGLAIHTYRHVYHSNTWGGGSVAGQRMLLCGSQALGMADIGEGEWVEKYFDYDNQPGISLGKIVGMKKPVFRSAVTGTNEDFGVIAVDTAV
jgi:N4-gp56 family major capsid protein